MPIVRWDPFNDLVQFRDEIGRWFESSAEKDKEKRSSSWAPNIDIKETDKDIIVKADLPGMDIKDIDVSIDQDSLILKGERTFEKEEKEKDYVRVERSYGSFYRSFNIGVPVKENEIKASYQNGVLDVVIPKAEVKKAKKVEIESK